MHTINIGQGAEKFCEMQVNSLRTRSQFTKFLAPLRKLRGETK